MTASSSPSPGVVRADPSESAAEVAQACEECEYLDEQCMEAASIHQRALNSYENEDAAYWLEVYRRRQDALADHKWEAHGA